MGREVRQVPADWQHPKDSAGEYIPLCGGSYETDFAEWDEKRQKWEQGLVSDCKGGWLPKAGVYAGRLEDWIGKAPRRERYMQSFPPGTATHLMMYENTTEGTPISPAFGTREELARWLADTGASASGRMAATYEQWLAAIQTGQVPTLVMTHHRLLSGVEEAVEGQDEVRKPVCKLTGTDGNVFAVIGRVKDALSRAGEEACASEFVRQAFEAKSYDEVLQLCMRYVEVR